MPLTGERKREYMRRYLAANRERINAYFRQHYRDNREERLAKMAAYAKAHPEVNRAAKAKLRLKPEVRKREGEYTRKWREANRERFNAYANQWKKRARETDINYRIACRLRSRLHKKLSNRGIRKVKNTMALTGCDAKFLRGYLEGQFTPGMTWENIHIDHHIPCDAFDLTDPKQQEQCFHYSNLRPMFGVENLKKGRRMPILKDAE